MQVSKKKLRLIGAYGLTCRKPYAQRSIFHPDIFLYQFSFLTVRTALVPLPSVIPTAISAWTARSITSPAAKATTVFPLNKEPTPTESVRDMVALGIFVPFCRTDMVTAAPRLADNVVL